MMEESLAMRLRVLRAERGLSLTEAAERAGIQRQTLARWERGERHPHDVTLAKVAKAYDVPVEDLLEEPVPLEEASPETGRLITRNVPDAVGVSDAVSVQLIEEIARIVDAWRAGLKSDDEAELEVRELVA
jgi:transcriptional regulator with XRE-family HTH domain